jgi:hypothetical protein
MNGLTLDAHIDLSGASEADAVVIGSGMKTREIAADASIMNVNIRTGVPLTIKWPNGQVMVILPIGHILLYR